MGMGSVPVTHSLMNVEFSSGAVAKLRKATISFVMSAHPHATARVSVGGFL
jgi:hypothetical protein